MNSPLNKKDLTKQWHEAHKEYMKEYRADYRAAQKRNFKSMTIQQKTCLLWMIMGFDVYEIADKMGVTYQRIHQIQKVLTRSLIANAINKIRDEIEAELIKERSSDGSR